MSAVQLATTVLDAHRRLGRHLPGDLFADPALMMLLDLFVSDALAQERSIGSCCLAAGVPHSTALRWLNTLERRQLIERCRHPFDARSSVVRLTAPCRIALTDWLNACVERCEALDCDSGRSGQSAAQ